MIDQDTQQTTIKLITETLGVEPEDVSLEAHFYLDLNATPEEMVELKDQLDSALDINLPDFSADSPQTVRDLLELIDDSLL